MLMTSIWALAVMLGGQSWINITVLQTSLLFILQLWYYVSNGSGPNLRIIGLGNGSLQLKRWCKLVGRENISQQQHLFLPSTLRMRLRMPSCVTGSPYKATLPNRICRMSRSIATAEDRTQRR